MRRRLLLAVMCTGMFFVLLDVTIVNVALPAIRDDLGIDASGLAWVVDADTLGFACLMLSAGALGDRFGRRQFVLIGLAFLAAGSLVCALATQLSTLLVGRALQGIGGATLLPQTLAVITTAYPERREQARAIGVWAGVSSLALPAGPILGGVLVQSFGWPAVFWCTVPVAVAAFGLSAWLVEDPPRHPGHGIDPIGLALSTAGLALTVAALIQVGDRGWADAVVLTLLGIGAGSLFAFVLWERRATNPMVPRRLLRSDSVVPTTQVGLLMNFGGVGLLYLLTLYLETAQGRSALEAGLLLLPATLPLAALAPAAMRFAGRFGSGTAIAVGMTTAAAFGLLTRLLHPGTGMVTVGLVLLLLGLGLTLTTGPMVGALMASAPGDLGSTASATNNTARQIGSALGIAVLGTLAGDPSGSGFVDGLHRAGLVAAVCWAIAAVAARWVREPIS